MEKTISAYSIPHTEQWTMYSETGREYQVSVYIPSEPAPAEGYPVIYLLDGNALFGSVVEGVRLQTAKPDGPIPAVVVGIGYPTDLPYDRDGRAWDYTVRDENMSFTATGGADAFIQFIEYKLKPEIEDKVPINQEKQALLGHELGGFFTLYTLFNRPDLFQTYLSASPSISWKNHYISTLEDGFYQKLSDWEDEGNLQFKALLLGVGAAEDRDVVEEIRDMHTRLSTWQLSNFEVDLRIFLEEGHMTMLHPLISRGLAYFFE